MIAQTSLTLSTRGQGLTDITAEVAAWVRQTGLTRGLLTLFIQHTSASLTIQENADPDVLADLEAHMNRAVPQDNRLYRHTLEGPDDMPAHIRTVLTDVQLSIPVMAGRPALGTWQGIYVWEHRTRPHRRTVVLHLDGE